LKLGTKLKILKPSNIKDFNDFSVFAVPNLAEKGTKLLGKRFVNLIKILARTVTPVNMDNLMEFMDYKNKKSFRELYFQPLMQNEFIQRTIPDKPKAPNQQYLITKKGRLFLGGFEF
jgi:predicted transcriptional regulator